MNYYDFYDQLIETGTKILLIIMLFSASLYIMATNPKAFHRDDYIPTYIFCDVNQKCERIILAKCYCKNPEVDEK